MLESAARHKDSDVDLNKLSSNASPRCQTAVVFLCERFAVVSSRYSRGARVQPEAAAGEEAEAAAAAAGGAAAAATSGGAASLSDG